MKLWWKRDGDDSNANAAAEEDDQHDPVVMPPGTTTTAATAATGLNQAQAADSAHAAQTAPPHPVLTAALGAGITTAAQFNDMRATAATARRDLQAECVKQAVRCFGQENGPAKAKALESASYEDAKAMTGIWKETADAKFNATDEASAGAQTAAVRRAEDDSAVNAAPGAATQEPKIRSSAEIYADREKQGG